MSQAGTRVDAETRLARVLRLLQGTIRAAGFTQTELDGRIGRRRGYLSHVFQRRVDLKLIDLLRGLEVLGVDPGRFFQALFSSRTDERAPTEDLMQLLSDLRADWPGSPRDPGSPKPVVAREEDAELLERIRQAVRALLAGRSNEQDGPA